MSEEALNRSAMFETVRLRRDAHRTGEPPPGEAILQPEQWNWPTGFYRGTLSKILGFSIRGGIWYQGESNTNDAELYRHLFPELVRSWRDEWELQREFPFYYVQLAGYEPPPESLENQWAELRDVQRRCLDDIPKSGMVTITDVSERDDIHPPRKRPVGERLASLALGKGYGIGTKFQCPIPMDRDFSGSRWRVTFDCAGDSLRIDGSHLMGLELIMEDGQTVACEGFVRDNDLFFEPENIDRIREVRFDYANFPETNLFSKGGLPASPFRLFIAKD